MLSVQSSFVLRKWCRSSRVLFSTIGGSKVYSSAEEALVTAIKSNDTVCIGGFGLSGIPETLIYQLSIMKEIENLTIASLTAGIDGFGLGLLFERTNCVKRLLCSYVGENKNFEQMFFNGSIEVELTPQGTLAARMRAAGAGIPAFYTPTGAGTIYAQGGIPIKYSSDGKHTPVLTSSSRETRTFHSPKLNSETDFVLEHALYADVSLIKAYKADERGNCVFRGTARNANPDAAMAGRICIVEAEEILETGELDPDEIHLPGVYVDRVILAERNEKRIERYRVSSPQKEVGGKRSIIMKRAAKEFKDGMYVNLGIGMPTMTSNYVPEGVKIELQAENGLMGIGPFPDASKGPDPDWINAGKETITAIPGASTFSSSDSFAMIRGGHVHLTILGGLQVSADGDLASWIIPGTLVKGMGGAMDLVCAPGAKVVITMDHIAKDGTHKILEECSLPLTGRKVVDRIITDMAVFDCNKKEAGGLTLIEIAPGFTVEGVRRNTGCNFKVADPLPLMVDEKK